MLFNKISFFKKSIYRDDDMKWRVFFVCVKGMRPFIHWDCDIFNLNLESYPIDYLATWYRSHNVMKRGGENKYIKKKTNLLGLIYPTRGLVEYLFGMCLSRRTKWQCQNRKTLGLRTESAFLFTEYYIFTIFFFFFLFLCRFELIGDRNVAVQ